MRKTGNPHRNELVICRITKLHPNSAYADLIEYDIKGMVHVSEVAKKWVRDIRDFLKENQYVVCKVMGVEESIISLSVKRVRKVETNQKLNEFKREKRSEKLLEQVAKSISKDLDQAWEEVGYDLLESFGSLTKTFEAAVKNKELLERKKVPKAWRDAIIKIAEKSFADKTYTVKGKLKLVSYKSDGIKAIKDAITKNKGDLEVKYISAPEYEIVGTGKNFKELEAKVRETGEAIVKAIEAQSGEGELELQK